MPMFHYEATDRTGKSVAGSMSEKDEGAVQARLIQSGYKPTLVELPGAVIPKQPPRSSFAPSGPSAGTAPPRGTTYSSSSKPIAHRGQRAMVVVPNRDLTQFYRQMSSMLGSGVGLPQAIDQIIPYTRNRYLKEALEDVEATVARGAPMSQALERHPRAFSAGHVGVIRSGEGGGFVVRALAELANQTEADASSQTAAKFNPLLFLVRYAGLPFVVAWAVFMLGWGSWSTNLNLLNHFFFRAAVAFVLTIVVQAVGFPIVAHFIRVSPLAPVLGALKSAIPGLNAVQSRKDRVKTLASLSSALAAGVPLSLAWELCCEAPDSDLFQRKMAEQQPAINQGGSIAQAMGRTGLYTDRIMQMAHTGELSGNLPEMLQQATIFERDEARHISNLMPWVIAVALYVILLLVGGFLVIKAAGGYGSMLNGMSGQ